MKKFHIRRGDSVQVLSGKCRGQSGVVLKVFPDLSRVIVQGINMVHKFIKPAPAQNQTGGIRKQESSIHVSNVMLIDSATGQATRIGRKRNALGKLERYSKKTGNFISNVKA